jgi:hypothetical protein
MCIALQRIKLWVGLTAMQVLASTDQTTVVTTACSDSLLLEPGLLSTRTAR